MRTRLFRAVLALVAAAAVHCGPAEEQNPNPNPNPNPSGDVTVEADITADTRWTADNTYILKKHIFVEGGTLTIEAGTKILGEKGSSLVVTPAAKIAAEGTREKPVVFSSAMPEGERNPGDWGGVVLLGKAPINVSGGSEKIEGFPASEARTVYGGSDAAHDCGSITFARIEYAGFELAPDNELNGLTVGGCGNATKLDYIQVHKGADDGVEFFGGTADISHLVISQPDDDGLDWAFGWTGRVQFAVVQQNSSVGNYGIEADSNENNADAAPRAQPTIYNLSLIGSKVAPKAAGKFQSGILFRRGTAGKLYNTLLTDFADQAIDVDESSAKQAQADQLFLKNSILFNNGGATWPAEAKDNDKGFDEEKFFTVDEATNRTVDPQLHDAQNLTAPNFLPKAGSPALTGAATPPNDGFFDSTATFVGAFGATDWSAGWTAYPEK